MIRTTIYNGRSAMATALLLLLVLLQRRADAQPRDFREELQKINNTYDSAIFLSFHVNYQYHTDTVSNRSKATALDGDYTLNGRKAFYRIGNIEYLRNDSFAIAAYNDNNFLMVTKLNGPTNRSSTTLPIKAIMDSMFLALSQHYTVTWNTKREGGDSIRHVHFKKITGDSAAPYDYMSVSYDSRSYFLRSLEYGFRQYVQDDGSDTTTAPPLSGAGTTAPIAQKWRVRFGILFSNYRVESLDPNTFSETRFITPVAADKWKAVDSYKGYKIYLSGTKR